MKQITGLKSNHQFLIRDSKSGKEFVINKDNVELGGGGTSTEEFLVVIIGNSPTAFKDSGILIGGKQQWVLEADSETYYLQYNVATTSWDFSVNTEFLGSLVGDTPYPGSGVYGNFTLSIGAFIGTHQEIVETLALQGSSTYHEFNKIATYKSTTIIDSTGILDSFNNPILVVAAPTPGSYISKIKVTLIYQYGSIPYGGAGGAILRFFDNSDQALFAPATLTGRTTDFISVWEGSMTQYDGGAIYLRPTSIAPTDGDGQLIMIVEYREDLIPTV